MLINGKGTTDLPSHSEAIRRLVKIALRSGDSETMKMITAIIRPINMKM